MESLQKIAAEVRLVALRAKKLFHADNISYTLQEVSDNIDSNLFLSPQYNILAAEFSDSITAINALLDSSRLVGTTYSSASIIDKISLIVNVTENIASFISSIEQIQTTLESISTASGSSYTDEFKDLARDLTKYLSEYLLIDHLVAFHQKLFSILLLLGFIRDRVPQPITNQSVPSNKRKLYLEGISELLSNPKSYFASLYGWGNPNFAYRSFLANIEEVLNSFSIPVYFLPRVFEPEEIPALQLYHASITPVADAVQAFVLDIKDNILNGVFRLPAISTVWDLSVSVNADISPNTRFFINWDGSLQATFPQGLPSTSIAIVLSARLPTLTTPYSLFTTPLGAGLTVSSIEVEASFTMPALTVGTSTIGESVMAFTVSLMGLNLSIDPGETDSFISKLLGGKTLNIQNDLVIDWTQANGLTLRGTKGLQVQKSFDISIGPTRIQNLVLGLIPQDDNISAIGLLSLNTQLGPVKVTVSNLGFQAILQYGEGNFGLFGVAFSFKSPSGIGIEIESEYINGGGYLYIDTINNTYSGVASLSFREKIKLNAVGLLQTKLPNNRNGYSFVLLVTAEFTPIQLGLGFTLNGIGGAIGLNRHVNITFLQGLVRVGGMEQLLFPTNVMDNPTAALAVVDSSFPVAEGRYVFGIMAKLGWGTPTLITLDVALLIELPSPVRLAILGILRATLPDLDHPILRLRADFLGTIDFATQRIAFDATLHDSGLLWFALNGDMAFRLYQGQNPVFVLTAGGFHPGFQPPANANLPSLQRLTLSLADSNDFRLILSSYFAITSNTVQFGSRLELYVNLFSKCTLEGYLYFDTLFQFHPFQVTVQVGGGIAIKWDNDEKLSIHLRLNVTGPGPWHVRGQADFELLGIPHSHDIDKTFGNAGGISQPALPDVNVRSLLLTAIADKSNWEIEVPSYRAASPVVLRPSSPSSNLLVDPNGILTFRQKLIPLGFQLDRYGNARATQGNKFEIVAVVLGADESTTFLTDTKDFFSPGQFRQMNDSIRLSSPSFQLMNNGFRVFGPDGYASGPAAVRGVEYELIILAPGSLLGSAATFTPDQEPELGTALLPEEQSTETGYQQNPGSDTSDTLLYPRIAIPSVSYQQLTKNSAIGRAYAQDQQSNRIANHLSWQEERYEVVYAADLAPYVSSRYAYSSEAEATAYLQEQTAEYPQLSGELLVIPTYQLAL